MGKNFKRKLEPAKPTNHPLAAMGSWIGRNGGSQGGLPPSTIIEKMKIIKRQQDPLFPVKDKQPEKEKVEVQEASVKTDNQDQAQEPGREVEAPKPVENKSESPKRKGEPKKRNRKPYPGVIDMNGTKFYSLNEVANLTGVTVRTLRKYMNEGRLKAVKMGGQCRVAEENYIAFINGEAPVRIDPRKSTAPAE